MPTCLLLTTTRYSSGSSEVTFVAEAGPNGQITLVPQEQVALESNEIVENANVPAANSEVDQMESEFENLRKQFGEEWRNWAKGSWSKSMIWWS